MRETYRDSAVSRVSAALTAATLDAEDRDRAALLVYIEPGSSTCFIKYGTTPTTTSYTIQIPPGYAVDVAAIGDSRVWTGDITCIWDGTSGSAQVTKVTR
jgi:hypothetical protein